MQADIDVIVGFGVRESGSPAEESAAAFIRNSLGDLGLDAETRGVPLPTGLISSNILASFGEGDLHVLLGAHFDTKPPSPGADDNASGTAVLLELARRFARETPEGLRITLVFFGAEEILVGYDKTFHHFGSRLLALEMKEAGDLPDMMVSADMIGVGDLIVAATYFDEDPAVADLLVEAGTILGLEIDKQRRGDISDHEPFALEGVPSVMLWRPDNPHYHLPTDLKVRTEALLDDVALLESFLSLLPVGS